MRKKVGIVKGMLCLLLIFLLSINSFAAIVSDNDGSAFITKAEFDALKSSFQSQIDTYNQSIDSKIDGAIANYLSGIKLSKKDTIADLVKNAKANGSNNTTFVNRSSKSIAASTDGECTYSSLWGAWYAGYDSPNTFYMKVSDNQMIESFPRFHLLQNNNNTGHNFKSENAYYFLSSKTIGGTTYYYLADKKRYCIQLYLSFTAYGRVGDKRPNNCAYSIPTSNTTVDYSSLNSPGTKDTVSISVGSMTGGTNPVTNMSISGPASQSTSITLYSGATNDEVDNDPIICIADGKVGIEKTWGVLYDNRFNYDGSTYTCWTNCKDDSSWTGQGDRSACGCNPANLGGSTACTNPGYFKNVNFYAKYKDFKRYNVDVDKFINSYWSDITGKPYYFYYGIPIGKLNSSKEGTIKLKMNVTGGVGAIGTITCVISNEAFKNEDLPLAVGGNILHVQTFQFASATMDLDFADFSYEPDTAGENYIYLKVSSSQGKVTINEIPTFEITYED